MKQPDNNVRVLQTTPVKEGWRAVYAVRGENGRAKIEEERIGLFALCENGEGERFVSGVQENGELCVMRDDFVGHFSVKEGRHKIRDAAEGLVRAREHEKGNQI